MKKTLAILMASLMILALGACGTTTQAPVDNSTADNSWNYIKEKGEIIVGLDDTFAPMGFRDEAGNLVGFDIDLANLVGAELGVEIKFQPIEWSAKELELSSKNIDLIWNGMSKTPERVESMNLSNAYLNNTLVIMTKAGSLIKTKADLAGKNVATQEGSSGLKVIEEDAIYPQIKDKLVQYKSYDEALMDLEIGRVDAVIVDKVLGMYKATKKPNTFAFASEDFGEDLYVIGMRKGEDEFTKKLNDTLKTLIDNGKASEASVKWFGEDEVIK